MSHPPVAARRARRACALPTRFDPIHTRRPSTAHVLTWQVRAVLEALAVHRGFVGWELAEALAGQPTADGILLALGEWAQGLKPLKPAGGAAHGGGFFLALGEWAQGLKPLKP